MFIDEKLKGIENQERDVQKDQEMSILEKLYKIDRNTANTVVLDLLLAGVDTVILKQIFNKN